MNYLSVFMRKNPVQARALQTMDTIFEATTQLLDTDTVNLNTNQVAVRAGFSIGTLYSYFPDKNSLLRAMALHEFERLEQRITVAISALTPADPMAIATLLVRQAINPFNGRNKVRRRLIAIIGFDQIVLEAGDEAISRITDRVLAALGMAPHEATEPQRYLLLRSALGPIRAGALQEPRLLASPEFEQELTQQLYNRLIDLGNLPRQA